MTHFLGSHHPYSGDFADLLGEDFLGLRELGIAAEFGMSSLTIPKKLLRGKKTQKATGNTYVPRALTLHVHI